MTYNDAYKNKAEAIEAMIDAGWEESSDGTWYIPGDIELGYNEYATADYKPVRTREGWMVKKIYHEYVGTLNPRNSKLLGRWDFETGRF